MFSLQKKPDFKIVSINSPSYERRLLGRSRRKWDNIIKELPIQGAE